MLSVLIALLGRLNHSSMFYISRQYYYQPPRPEIGRWHVTFRWFRNHFGSAYGMQLEMGIYKLIQLPEEGAMLHRDDYKGFRFHKYFYMHPLEAHAVWNLPTNEEIKQRILIWKMRIVRSLFLWWVTARDFLTKRW